MNFVPPPVLLSSSTALEEPVYPWSCAVMAILTVLINLMRSSVLRLQKSQGVFLGSSVALMDSVCLLLKCVMEDWTVGLLMTQMSEVTHEVSNTEGYALINRSTSAWNILIYKVYC